MKKEKLFGIVLILGILVASCAEKNEWAEGNVEFRGKILSSQEQKSVSFIFFDLVNNNMQTKISTEINNDGSFAINIPIYYPQELYFEYMSNYYEVICAPNDKIIFELNPEKKSVKVVDGNRTKDNEDVREFLKLLNPEKLRKAKFYVVDNESFEKYKEHVLSSQKENESILNRFLKENKTSSFFKKWANDYLSYETLNDLIAYPSYLKNSKNIEAKSRKLQKDYYDFLKNYDMNDNSFISIKHANFLHNLSFYVNEHPKDSLDKAYKIFREGNIVKGAEILKSMIKHNTSGFTKDLMLTKFYYDAIAGKQLKEFEALYDSTEILDTYFKRYIDLEYQKLQNFMSNQITESANLSSIKSSSVKELINDLLLKYNGKVIYIDFWAPWCSPCMKQMPYAKQLHVQYKEKDVAFVYLANRCSKDAWKATIANHKMKGEHYLLTNDQYSILSNEFGISGIPHYVLIDKYGRIVEKDAPRPSNKDIIMKSLNILLDGKD